MQNFGDTYVICIKLQICIAYYPNAVIGLQLAELRENKIQREIKKKINQHISHLQLLYLNCVSTFPTKVNLSEVLD